MNGEFWHPGHGLLKNVTLNRTLFEQREMLCQERAYEDKLAFAIEEGRVYGLRQQKYGMLQKKALNKEWRRPPVTEPW